jgi:hypothetical protein
MKDNTQKDREKIQSTVISSLAQIEEGASADQAFAILNKLKDLFEKYPGFKQELDLVNSAIKTEMRIFYRSKEARHRKALSLRLNKLLSNI